MALAARVANAATGGETLVSRSARDRVGSGFRYGAARTMTFKGFTDAQVVDPLEP